jgi:hypothetical protein
VGRLGALGWMGLTGILTILGFIVLKAFVLYTGRPGDVSDVGTLAAMVAAFWFGHSSAALFAGNASGNGGAAPTPASPTPAGPPTAPPSPPSA